MATLKIITQGIAGWSCTVHLDDDQVFNCTRFEISSGVDTMTQVTLWLYPGQPIGDQWVLEPDEHGNPTLTVYTEAENDGELRIEGHLPLMTREGCLMTGKRRLVLRGFEAVPVEAM